jgi:hypothetical protein
MEESQLKYELYMSMLKHEDFFTVYFNTLIENSDKKSKIHKKAKRIQKHIIELKEIMRGIED